MALPIDNFLVVEVAKPNLGKIIYTILNAKILFLQLSLQIF